MRWPDGRYIQAAVFFSRWLLAPFLLGLLLCLFLLIYRFFADLFVFAIRCGARTGTISSPACSISSIWR